MISNNKDVSNEYLNEVENNLLDNYDKLNEIDFDQLKKNSKFFIKIAKKINDPLTFYGSNTQKIIDESKKKIRKLIMP